MMLSPCHFLHAMVGICPILVTFSPSLSTLLSGFSSEFGVTASSPELVLDDEAVTVVSARLWPCGM
jgi:hypothetical protein